MNTIEEPESKTQEEPEKVVTKDPKTFIKQNLGKFNKPVANVTMTNVSPSYWRVNIWEKKSESFADNRLITSRFIRIDVDKDGKLVYNDVTEGKQL